MKYDRMLDVDVFWALPDLLDKVDLGVNWLDRVVREHGIERLRDEVASVRGTDFWRYVIQVLPRGASLDAERAGFIRYDLEGSLWMVFYEMSSHVRTIQRIKTHQGLPIAVDLPRFGYLRLPEYWGETDANGPGFTRLPTRPMS
jgi:hypothetical protein